MNAVEFSTIIEQGTIHLPKQYEQYSNASARVILLIDSNSESLATSQEERLRRVFGKMKNVPMFRHIDNPVFWQKEVRDEWE
jgi:hypothetical protein